MPMYIATTLPLASRLFQCWSHRSPAVLLRGLFSSHPDPRPPSLFLRSSFALPSLQIRWTFAPLPCREKWITEGPPNPERPQSEPSPKVHFSLFTWKSSRFPVLPCPPEPVVHDVLIMKTGLFPCFQKIVKIPSFWRKSWSYLSKTSLFLLCRGEFFRIGEIQVPIYITCVPY